MIILSAKELNKRILFNIMSDVIAEDEGEINVLLGVYLNIHYAFFVAIRMDGAETSTIISILAVDFLRQLWMTIQIIRITQKLSTNENVNLEEVENWGEEQNKKHRQEREEAKDIELRKEIVHNGRKEAIAKLILAEYVEGIVP